MDGVVFFDAELLGGLLGKVKYRVEPKGAVLEPAPSPLPVLPLEERNLLAAASLIVLVNE